MSIHQPLPPPSEPDPGRKGITTSRLVLKPCINCRRRKVKCDRGQPCTECTRFAKVCAYEDEPTSEQLGPVQDQQESLQARVDRLERLLQDKPQKSVVEDGGQATIPGPARTASDMPSSVLTGVRPDFALPENVETGSLMVDRGLSLYIANGHWVKLFEETEELEMLLKPKKLSQQHGLDVNAILPHYAHLGSSLVRRHPGPDQSGILCDLFLDRMEPFIRVLHTPSFKKEHHLSCLGRCTHPREFEALLFPIYSLAVLHSSSEEVQQILGEPRSEVLARYRLAAEVALSDTYFMRSRDLLSFQALLYWITFLYESGDFETATSLVGLANQVGYRLGLHKDSTSSKVTTPFTNDTRNRAWNHLHYLNSRGFEIEGLDLPPPTTSSTSLFPRNVNEADWEAWLHTKFSPPPRIKSGFSDMTFVILRRQLTSLMQSLLTTISSLSVVVADDLLRRAREEVWANYLQHFDPSQPMQKFVGSYIEIFLDKTALAVDIGHVKYGRRTGDDFKNEIFLRAINILSSVTALETEFSHFGWSRILRASPEWHCIAAILCHLMHRSSHFSLQEIDRAWEQVAFFLVRHDNADFTLRDTPSWQVIEHWRQRASDLQQHGQSNGGGGAEAFSNLPGDDIDWNATLNMDAVEFEETYLAR